ncbi:endonuclease domain-containing protein [Pseudonocardia oroxyli]|uniref:endonuclease domain-containing protein n=1 Tax=Pseudonocardia oroxyli TaxID=366584 RepID=UPI00115FE6EC|nr:DUF559 domain-containing protein [Pseudonocardia oroxyli]
MTYPQLQTAHQRMQGARGATRAGVLLRAAAIGAESVGERRVLALLEDAGITGWVLGHRIGDWRLDVAFVRARVALEFDGWAWHVDPARFVDDRRKGNDLVGAGWTLLRFTWQDLENRPAVVVAQIRRALQDRPETGQIRRDSVSFPPPRP